MLLAFPVPIFDRIKKMTYGFVGFEDLYLNEWMLTHAYVEDIYIILIIL